MSKGKIVLASVITVSALSLVGCSGGGGSTSSVTGTDKNAGPKSNGTTSYTYNTATDLRINIGTDDAPQYVSFSSATNDATADAPPSAPVLRR
ncbi:MAG: hypothetical protein OIF32_05810 [Campylobacterales bacterium]|nr:hypothetical protein [Campylobacterales bacterium]